MHMRIIRQALSWSATAVAALLLTQCTPPPRQAERDDQRTGISVRRSGMTRPIDRNGYYTEEREGPRRLVDADPRDRRRPDDVADATPEPVIPVVPEVRPIVSPTPTPEPDATLSPLIIDDPDATPKPDPMGGDPGVSPLWPDQRDDVTTASVVLPEITPEPTEAPEVSRQVAGLLEMLLSRTGDSDGMTTAVAPIEMEAAGVMVQAAAPIGPGGVAAARSEAVYRALVQAVEQRLGYTMDNRRVAERHILVRDRLERLVMGDVGEYDVTQEEQRLGAVWVSVRVRLRGDVIDQAGLSRPRLGFVIAVDEATQDPNVLSVAETQEYVEMLLAEALDRDDMSVVSMSIPFDEEDDPMGYLRAESQRLGVDMILLCAPSVRQKNVMAGMSLCTGALQSGLIRPATGQVLWQDRRDADGQRAISIGEAGRTALRNAATGMATDVIRAMGQAVNDLTYSEVEVLGMTSAAKKEAFQTAMENITGVRSVEVTGDVGGPVLYVVYSTPEAARALPGFLRRLAGVNLEVVWTAPLRVMLVDKD